MEEREKFRKNLDNFLVDLQIERELHTDFDEKRIYDNASTKEERQNYLDKFFRVICLQVKDKKPQKPTFFNITVLRENIVPFDIDSE
jgi:hypothetical protein